MKFVLASYGGRGDVEPAVVVGRELLQRGHDVCMAVPPNLVDFAEAAGLPAVSYGLDSQSILDTQREYWSCYFRTPWKLKELNRMGRETAEFAMRCWAEMTTTLVPLARGADLLMTGLIFEQPAANVAEYHGIPLSTLHFFPVRAHGQRGRVILLVELGGVHDDRLLAALGGATGLALSAGAARAISHSSANRISGAIGMTSSSASGRAISGSI